MEYLKAITRSVTMEQIYVLLENIKAITLKDISTLPNEYQHLVALRLEQLQDELKRALKDKNE